MASHEIGHQHLSFFSMLRLVILYQSMLHVGPAYRFEFECHARLRCHLAVSRIGTALMHLIAREAAMITTRDLVVVAYLIPGLWRLAG